MLPERLGDTKVTNLLIKVAQKVATLKNQIKTGFQQVLKSYILDFFIVGPPI